MQNTILILGVLIFTWLILLTIYFIKLSQTHKKLFSSQNYQNLDDLLKDILNQIKRLSTNQTVQERNIEELKINAKTHIKYSYFLRYNPFEKSKIEGQSFVIVLLDETKTGILINFLYTNNQYRVYPKLLKEGKPKNVELTKEEKEAIELAVKTK